MPAAQFLAMAQALGVISAAQYPYTVTFSRRTEAKGSAGGNTNSSANTTPANIPCRYQPSSGSEIETANKTIGGVPYSIFVPNVYSGSLVDVDSRCTGTIAAVAGLQAAINFTVIAPLREMGLEILVLVSVES